MELFDLLTVITLSLGGFIILFVISGFILSRIGGWQELSRHYHCTKSFEGRTWNFDSGMLGTIPYNLLLHYGADEHGLHLQAVLPYKKSHPPLFIPWEDITVKSETTMLFFKFWMRFNLKCAPDIVFKVPKSTADELIRYSAGKILVSECT